MQISRSDRYPGLGRKRGDSSVLPEDVAHDISFLLSGQNTWELRTGNLITLL